MTRTVLVPTYHRPEAPTRCLKPVKADIPSSPLFLPDSLPLVSVPHPPYDDFGRRYSVPIG